MQWTWLEDRCRHVHIRSNACHHARLTLEHHEASSSSSSSSNSAAVRGISSIQVDKARSKINREKAVGTVVAESSG